MKFEFINGKWLGLEKRADFSSVVNGAGRVEISDEIFEVYSIPLVGDVYIVKRSWEQPLYSRESGYTQLSKEPRTGYLVQLATAVLDRGLRDLFASIQTAREEILKTISACLLTSCRTGNELVVDFSPSGTLRHPEELSAFRKYTRLKSE